MPVIYSWLLPQAKPAFLHDQPEFESPLSIRFPLRAMRLLVLSMMLASAFLLPLGDLLSHGLGALTAMQAEHTTDLVSLHAGEGHGHASDSGRNADADHDHGHHSFDHSHAVAYPGSDRALVLPLASQVRVAGRPPHITHRIPKLLDRPPMRITTV